MRALARQHGLGEVVGPVTIHVHDELVFEPDLVFVPSERSAIIDPEGDVHGVPDLVVEILSPSTRSYDRNLKRQHYLDAGVPELWLVDIDARSVEVWRPGSDQAERLDDAVTWRVGELTLEQDRDADAVRAGVSLLAEVHQRFAGHLMIAEAREWGGDLGCTFYSSSARDAITCLEAVPPPRLEDDDVRALRDRLLSRMWELLAEETERTDAVRELGGPETLVHGDLWLKNVSVVREHGVCAKLIDWDHAGVGPAGYDLSTFLNGFDAEDRDAVLDQYRDALAGTALEPPGPGELNALFDTFERARIANCVVWSAFAVSEGPHVEWAISGVLASPVSLRWIPQPVAPGQLRAECTWTGPAGSAGALAGAAAVLVLVVTAATRQRRLSAIGLLLAGVATNSVCAALILLIHGLSGMSQSFTISRWLIGSLDAIGALGIAWLTWKEGREAFAKARGMDCSCACNCG